MITPDWRKQECVDFDILNSSCLPLRVTENGTTNCHEDKRCLIIVMN